MHNKDEPLMFYHMGLLHPGLTSLQEDFIAIRRSKGNAMETGIASRRELGMLIVITAHTIDFSARFAYGLISVTLPDLLCQEL